MNDMVQEDPVLGTSTLRGVLLLGGVAAVAYLAYEFWYKQRQSEGLVKAIKNTIRVPINLPLPNPHGAKKK